MWIFIQDQILGLKWLNVMIGNLLTVLGIDTTGRMTSVTLKVISFTYHQREKRALFYSIS